MMLFRVIHSNNSPAVPSIRSPSWRGHRARGWTGAQSRRDLGGWVSGGYRSRPPTTDGKRLNLGGERQKVTPPVLDFLPPSAFWSDCELDKILFLLWCHKGRGRASQHCCQVCRDSPTFELVAAFLPWHTVKVQLRFIFYSFIFLFFFFARRRYHPPPLLAPAATAAAEPNSAAPPAAGYIIIISATVTVPWSHPDSSSLSGDVSQHIASFFSVSLPPPPATPQRRSDDFWLRLMAYFCFFSFPPHTHLRSLLSDIRPRRFCSSCWGAKRQQRRFSLAKCRNAEEAANDSSSSHKSLQKMVETTRLLWGEKTRVSSKNIALDSGF